MDQQGRTEIVVMTVEIVKEKEGKGRIEGRNMAGYLMYLTEVEGGKVAEGTFEGEWDMKKCRTGPGPMLGMSLEEVRGEVMARREVKIAPIRGKGEQGWGDGEWEQVEQIMGRQMIEWRLEMRKRMQELGRRELNENEKRMIEWQEQEGSRNKS